MASETLTVKGKYANIESSPVPLQRALLSSVAGRRCGPSTPVPCWKMYDMPFQGAPEPFTADVNSRIFSKEMAARQSRCPRSTVSARKLAAALWEMQGALNSSRKQVKEKSKPRERVSSQADHSKAREGSAKQDLVGSSHRRLDFEEWEGAPKQQPYSGKMPSKGSKSRNQCASGLQEPEVSEPTVLAGAHQWGEYGSTLSSELVKVLNQIWALEEQQSESSTLVTSLRSELKKTKSRIKELQKEQTSYQEDIETMNKKLSDEKKLLMDRAEEAVSVAVKSVKDELDAEKKSRTKLESRHKKLSKEISETRKVLTKTIQDFEREQKARELMEDVCDELAREIGEDKAQVEELKRQSAKYREEVEQERRMLQMAEVWREERVHMKLAEAKFELEEKNAALDRLRSELEAFLKAKRLFDEESRDDGKIPASNAEGVACAQHVPKHMQGCGQPIVEEQGADVFCENRCREGVGALEDEESFDDDLHSIELNRVSCSGSQEVLPSGYSNPVATSNGKLSPNRAALFQPLVNETSFKLGEGREVFSSGKINGVESNAGQNQDVIPQLFTMDSESGVKEWDLGKQPWPMDALSSFLPDRANHGFGPNAQGRWSSGKMDYLLRNGSGAGSDGAALQDGLGLSAQGESRHGCANSLLRSASKGETGGPLHGTHSKLEIFELPRDYNLEPQNGGSLFCSKGQVSMYPGSPTNKQAYLLSPGPAKSNKASEPPKNAGKVSSDSSLKARLMEAKLENQQARVRNK